MKLYRLIGIKYAWHSAELIQDNSNLCIYDNYTNGQFGLIRETYKYMHKAVCESTVPNTIELFIAAWTTESRIYVPKVHDIYRLYLYGIDVDGNTHTYRNYKVIKEDNKYKVTYPSGDVLFEYMDDGENGYDKGYSYIDNNHLEWSTKGL